MSTHFMIDPRDAIAIVRRTAATHIAGMTPAEYGEWTKTPEARTRAALLTLADYVEQDIHRQCDECVHYSYVKDGADTCGILFDHRGNHAYCDDVGPCGEFEQRPEEE